MESFKDKVVVIPGGATGIGFAFAKAFGADGAKLVLAGRREDRLAEAAGELKELGVETRYFTCDVSKAEHLEKLADSTWSAFGGADVIINNAGIILPNAPLIETALEDVHNIFRVNFFGVWHGSVTFARRFIEQGKPAAIYNVGSENSLFIAAPLNAAYVATKHAVLALTEALREEMPDFIDVGLICPGFVRSEIAAEDAMALGMETDRFVATAMEQIRNREFFIVSHAYNIVGIDRRHQEIAGAYKRYAPRYDGDEEFDVRCLLAKIHVDEVSEPRPNS